MTLKAALKDRERVKSVTEAVEDEVKNLVKNKVIRVVRYSSIPTTDRKKIIPVHIFLKDKYKSDGSFDKIKARIVVNGDRVDTDLVGETFSPTVNPISVLTQLNLAAQDPKTTISSYDVKGAFLVTPITDGTRMFIRIPKDIVEHWTRIYPHEAEKVHKDGCLYCELEKYMYGLPQSPHEFNSYADKIFRSKGFEPSKADPCVYVKKVPEGFLIATLWVDDILLTTPGEHHRIWFEEKIGNDLELVAQYGDLSHLGMLIKRDPQHGDVYVSQEGFIADIVAKYGAANLRKGPATPATENLTKHDSDSPPCDTTKYLSLVMSLMYLARFTVPAILLPVTYLATRSSNPTDEDYQKALRIVRYLSRIQKSVLHFKRGPIAPVIYADASHAFHPSGHAQGALVISLGSAPVFCRSFKIKAATRSSTESELYALEEASTYAVWFRLLLSTLGIDVQYPIPVFQDNKSAIIIAMQGGQFKRTKHLLCKESFLKERIESGDIALKYLPTGQMPADMLTKPLGPTLLQRHLATLCVQ
jgi:hypothetical protein